MNAHCLAETTPGLAENTPSLAENIWGSLQTPWRMIRLQRDGAAPLRFPGHLIARHDGHIPGSPMGISIWHDLALYQVAGGGYGVAIVAMRRADGSGEPPSTRNTATPRPARCHAARFATLAMALSHFEAHDPVQDLCPGWSAPALALDDPVLAPAALLVQAAALRCAAADAVRRYRIGVGMFLAGLATRDR